MMKRFCFIALVFLPFILQAEEKVEGKVYWIDVRTLDEWNGGHLKEAVHIPYQQIGEKILNVTKDKNAKIHVYCKVGGRAGIAKKTLERLGYKKVVNSGGYEAIKAKRRQVKK